MTPNENSAETRVCNKCGREQPLTAFRLRYKNGTARHSCCNVCRNLHERWKRLRKHHRELSKGLTLVIRGPSTDRVTAAVSAMIRRFGGLNKFVETWWDHFQRAATERYGAGFIAKTFNAVFRMIDVADQIRRESQASAEDMTDEDLEFEVLGLFKELVREGKLNDTLREMVTAGELDLEELTSGTG